MSPQSNERKIVLIVEDHPDLLELLASILQGEGFEVVQARDGPSALAHPLTTPPRLVLLDLSLPIMDAREFVERLRGKPGCSDVPIVVLSADTKIRERARHLKAAGWLSKPFEMEELLRTARRFR